MKAKCLRETREENVEMEKRRKGNRNGEIGGIIQRNAIEIEQIRDVKQGIEGVKHEIFLLFFCTFPKSSPMANSLPEGERSAALTSDPSMVPVQTPWGIR